MKLKCRQCPKHCLQHVLEFKKLKTLYICGDSFSSPDPRFPGRSWPEKLAGKINTRYDVVNLSQPCSSNFFIGLQVEQAIDRGADFVIVCFTASSRDEIKFRHHSSKDKNLLEDFVDLNREDNTQARFSCYSLNSIDHTTLFEDDQLDLLRQYHKNFFDMDLAIKKNEIIIEGILSKLSASQIPFMFDQGGFEHPKFLGRLDKKYFCRYQQYRSSINLWDHAKTSIKNPRFHISDDVEIDRIVNHYAQIIV